MMHGHEKSDPAIVAVKPANKAEQSAAELGSEGRDQGECARAKHALDSAPGSRGTRAGTHAATSSLPFGPEVGAVCGTAARTVLCGGGEVTRVPTASCNYCCVCSRPLLALFVESLQRRNSGAIGATTDMPRWSWAPLIVAS
jgi:hypothetical protein